MINRENKGQGGSYTVDRRSFLRAAGAGAGAAVTAGITGASGDSQSESCGVAADPVTETGRLASGEARTFEYEVRAAAPCGVTLDLSTADDVDFDLYASLDGRTPTSSDHDRASRVAGDERIDLSAEEVPQEGKIGILIEAYRGEGEFTLTVEEFAAGSSVAADDDLVVVNTERVALDIPTRGTMRSGVYDLVSERPEKVELTARARERGEVELQAAGDRLAQNFDDDIGLQNAVEHPDSLTRVVESPSEFVGWRLGYEVEWDFWRGVIGQSNGGTYELVIREYALEEPEETDAPELVNREELSPIDSPVRYDRAEGIYQSVAEGTSQVVVKAYPRTTGSVAMEGIEDREFGDGGRPDDTPLVSTPGPATLVFRSVTEFVQWGIDYETNPLTGPLLDGGSRGTVDLVIEEYEY